MLSGWKLARRPAITPDVDVDVACLPASPQTTTRSRLCPISSPQATVANMSDSNLTASLTVDFSALEDVFKDGRSPYEKDISLIYQYGTAGFRMR